MSTAVPEIHVLLIEDEPVDALNVRRLLSEVDPDSIRLSHVERASGALAKLRERSFDAILLDLGLPDGQGMELLHRILAAAPQTPVLVLTGLDDERFGLEAVKQGAQDYLTKGHLSAPWLAAAIRYAIERQRHDAERTQLLERERAARQEVETAIRERDEILGVVIHVLRNPLNSIAVNSSLLFAAPPADQRRAQYHEAIERAVSRMSRLMKDIVDVVRYDAHPVPLELSSVEVPSVVQEVLAVRKAQAEDKGLTLEAELAGGLKPLNADRARIVALLSGLVSNAIKFTEKGGQITIRAERIGGQTQISVQDTGRGIVEEELPHLFNPFWRARHRSDEGGGTGLALAKHVVKAHGGKLWVESRVDEGSTFYFTLPDSVPLPA